MTFILNQGLKSKFYLHFLALTNYCSKVMGSGQCSGQQQFSATVFCCGVKPVSGTSGQKRNCKIFSLQSSNRSNFGMALFWLFFKMKQKILAIRRIAWMNYSQGLFCNHKYKVHRQAFMSLIINSFFLMLLDIKGNQKTFTFHVSVDTNSSANDHLGLNGFCLMINRFWWSKVLKDLIAFLIWWIILY